ncbi:phosphoglyceromutase [Thermoanaerobacterium sp. DL9XJH110]|uniref:phosphoglyceromutase n=1 Tax=Thermoanaerobacterium sp. DL9XJH110 TaxID=3386643 RepID=UPI003BB7818C
MQKIKLLLVISIIICLFPITAFAAPAPSEKRVVVFIMDGINYDDMVNFGGKNLKYLMENGALGLMNTNSGGSYNDSNAYATIGAGSYAVSSSYGSFSGGYDDLFDSEPVHVIYKRNTGQDMKKENIANIDISNLHKNNGKLNHPVKIGLLGTLLNNRGLKTAVIGNESRNAEEISVNAALITMNGRGITDYGRVGKDLLVEDPMSPFGVKTDYAALFSAYSGVKGKANFIVIQTGDTYRLNKYPGFSDEMYMKNKERFFKEADDFLGKILNTLDRNTLFIFAVPFPAREDIQAGKRLTPVIVYGHSVPSGILTSSTTKRDGIVTNTDLAAEILGFFGIPGDSSMTGHRFIFKNTENALNFLQNLNSISVFNYKARPVVVRVFIGFIVTVLILSIVFILHLKKYLVYLKPLLTSVMVTPTLFLLLPIFKPWDSARFALFSIALIAISGAGLARFLKDNLNIFAVSFLFSTALIIFDTFLGNPLMKVSILGYDPIGGARFYGIGNEYMGFLLGAAIIGTTALVEKHRRHAKMLKGISIVIYAIVLLTLALPTLGTNVGGTMAAFVGFGAAAILLFRGKINLKDLIKIGLALAICLLVLFIYDGTRPSDVQSHIGQTSFLIKQNSILALLQIFKRKLFMNYKLIKYSIWTWALMAFILALGVLFVWPVGIFKEIVRRHKYLYFGFLSGIVGSVAAFAFNDSGVVAAAISMIPIGMPLILLCVDEMYKKDTTEPAQKEN